MSADTNPARNPASPEGLILRSNEAVLNRGQWSQMMQLNLNTRNLNKSSYELNFGVNGENFNPGSYDPIALVWVQVSRNKKALLIRDGHHRASVIDKHWGNIVEKPGDFAPMVKDVTIDYLPVERKPQLTNTFKDVIAETPDLVIEATRDEWPPALTMQEYQRILIEPTIAQKAILPLRVAISLMTSWSSFVDDEAVEAKFPELAALAFLEQADIRFPDTEHTDQIRNVLAAQETFFTGGTDQEQQIIREALFSMATILADNRVSTSEVLDSTFLVVGARDEFLDVTSQTKKQLRGLFNLPIVDQKYAAQYGDEPHEWVKDRLYESFRGGLPRDRFGAKSQGRAMYNALVDPDLSISDVRAVFDTPVKKAEKHKAILTQKNEERLEQAYLSHVGRNKTIGRERGIISRFSGPERISQSRMDSVIGLIATYDDIYTEATGYLEILQRPVIGLSDQERVEFVTELKKKIRVMSMRRGDLLASAIVTARGLNARIKTTFAQIEDQSSTVTDPSSPALMQSSPEVVFLSAGQAPKSAGDRREDEPATVSTSDAIRAVTLFLLARTVAGLTHNGSEELPKPAATAELERLQRENIGLKNSAWWRSPDFNNFEQRLMQAWADGTHNTFMRDEEIASLDQFMALRKQILIKHRRLMQ